MLWISSTIDNDILVVVIAGSLLLFVFCTFAVAFTLLYQKKKKQEKIEKEQREAEFSKTLLQTQLEIKEQTLQNISHELHDNFGQLVSLINIHLNVIKRGNKEEASEAISEAKKLTKILVKDIKQLSLDLNGNRLAEIGLLSALQEEVERLQKLMLFSIDLQVEGNELQLKKDEIIILYRMSQEILNNIIKHSNAKEVLIKIQFLQNFLILVFQDNGRGFNITASSMVKGNGLGNLRNRAKLINAQFHIESAENKGTTVTIEIHT